jgi:integrase
MLAKAAVQLFLSECEARALRPKTIEAYSWALRVLSTCPGDVPASRSALLTISATPGLSPTSRFDRWRVLRTFYRWFEKHHNGPTWPEPPRPRTPNVFPRALTIDEAQRLLYYAPNRRDRALVTVALDTGLRVGEIASMLWPNITGDGVRVTGKTGARTVPMSQTARAAIIGLGDTRAVWTSERTGQPLTTNGVSQAVRRAMYRARILPPKAGPHTLRHTFGALYVMAGGDVFSLQRILGHASVETSMIYVRMNTGQLAELHSRFTPLLKIVKEQESAADRYVPRHA